MMKANKKPINITKSLMHYLDARIYEWSDWFNQKSPLGVGYPTQSIEYRLLTEGHVMREYLGIKPTPIHSAAEEIESLICEMLKQNQEMADVLRYYYTNLGDLPHKAKQMGHSEKYFLRQLECARWWLIARLTANKKLQALKQ